MHARAATSHPDSRACASSQPGRAGPRTTRHPRPHGLNWRLGRVASTPREKGPPPCSPGHPTPPRVRRRRRSGPGPAWAVLARHTAPRTPRSWRRAPPGRPARGPTGWPSWRGACSRQRSAAPSRPAALDAARARSSATLPPPGAAAPGHTGRTAWCKANKHCAWEEAGQPRGAEGAYNFQSARPPCPWTVPGASSPVAGLVPRSRQERRAT